MVTFDVLYKDVNFILASLKRENSQKELVERDNSRYAAASAEFLIKKKYEKCFLTKD